MRGGAVCRKSCERGVFDRQLIWTQGFRQTRAPLSVRKPAHRPSVCRFPCERRIFGRQGTTEAPSAPPQDFRQIRGRREARAGRASNSARRRNRRRAVGIHGRPAVQDDCERGVRAKAAQGALKGHQRTPDRYEKRASRAGRTKGRASRGGTVRRGASRLAEGVGFEPTLPEMPVKQFSRLPPSTARPPLRIRLPTDTADQPLSGLNMAERRGFEPRIRLWRIHDFQSCSFGQLGHLSASPRRPRARSAYASEYVV